MFCSAVIWGYFWDKMESRLENLKKTIFGAGA